jgi:Protein of unknown function (DUF3987)/RepB DNA-primase from phage plasmid
MRTALEVGKKTDTARRRFFQNIFGEETGYVCIATIDTRKRYVEEFFEYPKQLPAMLDYINRKYATRNLYFCPQLLRRKRRSKEVVELCTVAWADLDECEPSLVSPAPSIVTQTSAARYQAYWLLDSPADPLDAEDASRRIAYKHEAFGVDRSGWDLTQLLRVPLTYNLKGDEPFTVAVIQQDLDHRLPMTEFKKLPQVPGYEFIDIPLPKELLKIKPRAVFEKYKGRLDPIVLDLYREEPEADWSAALWLLERTLFEHGLSREEVFVVCYHAKCNKYARDKRPADALWRDVCKASTEDEIDKSLNKPPIEGLLSSEERNRIFKYETFIERYVEWARERTDAAPQYHEAGAFTILSAVLAGSLKAKTEHGSIIPNLWFMILGDTTLTRKSTAMDMAMGMLDEVNDDLLLATDGSVEGLLSSVASRPGKPGVFWRDEFSGFLEAISKRDYLAGMAETLTRLYDGKNYKKVLRKETVELRDPILIMLAGGIRGRVQELLKYEHILSGFVPRFIYIQGETDMSRIKPLGPATDEAVTRYDDLVSELSEINDRYNTPMVMHVGSQALEAPAEYPVELTKEAWKRHNEFLNQMYEFSAGSPNPETYTPTMDRLAMSGLKAAMLMAASRQDPEDSGKVIVELDDILRAIYYAERWREYSIDIIDNVGKSMTEKKVEYVYRLIRPHSTGVRRSEIMRQARLMARDADWILDTLEQRALIRRQRRGKGEIITPTGKSPATVPRDV